MTSNDIRIVINGQTFRVEGEVLKPVNESSFQQEVLKRLDSIELNQRRAAVSIDRIQSDISALKTEYQVMHEDIRVHDARLDMGIWFAGLCFGVLALVIAFVGIFAPKFWEHMTRRTKPAPEVDIDEVADKVAEILSRRYGFTPKN